MKYDTILKRKWDNENMTAYALKQAEEKGIQKGGYSKAVTTASYLRKISVSVIDVSKATGLSIEEVEKL